MCTKNHNHMRCNSWDIEWDNFFLPFWPIFVSPPNNPKKIFEKIKQASGDVTILNLCNKKHNQMIYAYSDMECTKNDNHMIYGSWDINCNWQIFLSSWAIFCPFTPPKKKMPKKWKKDLNIIILHMCTKNHYRLYCSWHMVHDICNCCFSFWAIFCPFTPLTAEMKISKKWKQCPEISSFYKIVPKIMIICYTVPDIWHITDVIVIFQFVLSFALYPLNSLKNENSKKNQKNWRYHHFTQVYQKSWSYAILFLRYGMWQM